MASEDWFRSQDGSIELCPVLDWETGVADCGKDGMLRLWFQIGNQQCNEDVQLQLNADQVKDLLAALRRLEVQLARPRAIAERQFAM
jgi:hypothetical protein